MIYPNMEAEISRAGLTKTGMAERLGVSRQAFHRWLTVDGAIRYGQAKKIQETFFPGYSLDYLLSTKPLVMESQEESPDVV